ncbi:hypothetical protein H6F43_07790 [Leptolyngbya sp. FACHB-36]|uniref:hypothetical protein n=1 Tax=Leptolyngbya sp. FACHB-36 TaxID=2692808 RepID=UPI001680DC27|nr:hypothetical protein [Leptolyngbya sp. FACHB-36]MBD2020087.1 hypothetical protein [Leptolyngbya sp. FACHB-36]
MLISAPFLRSLLLAYTLSFTAPLVLIGLVLASFTLVGQLPLSEAIGQGGAAGLLQFLAVFGSGSAVQGALVIGLASGSAGALFDTYAFYRHQSFRNG